jgi:hypothetical protein
MDSKESHGRSQYIQLVHCNQRNGSLSVGCTYNRTWVESSSEVDSRGQMVELAGRESDVYREKYKRTKTVSIGVSQSMGEKAEWTRQQCEGEYVECWIRSS